MKISLSPKNTKLGAIPSFSLPSVKACPMRTKLCEKLCYAFKIERIYKNASAAYELNMSLVDDPGFVTEMIIKIADHWKRKKAKPVSFRWHVSGDFKDIRYLYKIKDIMTAFPHIIFYGYTRNWSDPSWLSHLNSLRELPNFTLFASVDDEHIAKNQLPPKDWRVAYMGDSPVKTMRLIDCPEQAGKKLNGKKMTCETCGFCFKPILKHSPIGVRFTIH